MEELRKEVGVRESFTRKLVRSQIKWAGHVERMEGKRLTKRVDVLRVEGRKRRGRPRMRWVESVKRDLVGEGVEWRMRARDGGWWRWLVEMAMKQEQ